MNPGEEVGFGRRKFVMPGLRQWEVKFVVVARVWSRSRCLEEFGAAPEVVEAARQGDL